MPTGYNGYGAAMAMGQPMMPPQAMAMAGYGYAPMGYMAPPPGYGPAMGYPAPGGYPTMVAGYYPPVPPMPVPPVAAVASGEPGRASIGDQGGATAGLIGQLRGSLLPSEREMAADRLTRVDWRAEPQVVGALLTAAKGDPAPAVRAACVRSLGKMNVNLVPVVNVVRTLKADTDVRVRQEVEQTLATLGGE
ncbi:MAG: HEAT repeat domain-containing protein [Gemmataceae bacterium]